MWERAGETPFYKKGISPDPTLAGFARKLLKNL